MAIQGLARLLPLVASPSSAAPPDPNADRPRSYSSKSSIDNDTPPLLLPQTLLPRLEAALATTLQKPPESQTRADEGLLGSPHLALTLASLPPLARTAPASSASHAGVFRSPAFVGHVVARVGERGGGMQDWERGMVVEGLRALGVAAEAVPSSVWGGGRQQGER